MNKILTEKNSKVLLWIGFIIFIIGVLLFAYRESIGFNTKINAEKVGQLGDFIGGIVGSLWSLAGVILFYVALTEQRKDIEINQGALKQQITEFELQRVELKETRKIFEEQSETLKIQRFENTFFQLLSLHHELVDKLKFEKPSLNYTTESLEKRTVLTKACQDLNAKMQYSNYTHKQNSSGGSESKENFPESIEVAEERMNKVYKKFYFEDYKQILSHYFRNIYHIFKFIKTTELIKDTQKQFYATIVRAQLSSDELFLILYNSLQDKLGYPNFLYLIKEFDIMQNFDFGIIEKYRFHKEIYDQKIKNVKPEF